MSPRTKEQNIKIREDKKALIMQASLELFASKGIQIPISQIAEKSGVSKGLLYNYFDSKLDLLKEILLTKVTEIFSFFDPNNDGVLTRDEFIYFIDEIFRTTVNNIDSWRLYFIIVVQKEAHEILNKELEKLMPAFMRILINYFKTEGRKDPEAEAMFLISTLDGAIMDIVLNPEYFNADKLKKRIIETFIN